MGVYMPNMKMPKSCWDCPLDTPVCDLWRSLRDSAYEEMTKKRHDDCPLIEVPVPHGRLIDAHEVRTRMIGLSFSVQTWINEVELSNVPTVIEREEE